MSKTIFFKYIWNNVTYIFVFNMRIVYTTVIAYYYEE